MAWRCGLTPLDSASTAALSRKRLCEELLGAQAHAPEWAAKLKPTIERLRARDGGGGRKKQPRRKKAKNKRPAPAPAPAPAAAAELEALAAAAQEYAAARSNDDDDAAEPQARTISAPPDESAAEPTLQESLETRRDQLLAWLSLS